jgi:hypothetical protein
LVELIEMEVTEERRIVRRADKNGMTRAVIITFRTHSERFESGYERNKFFRELHGWKQTIPSESGNKSYSYERKGLLDEIPHSKIADSVFMTALENMKRIEEFFDHWQKKVDYDMMEIMCKRKSLLESFFDEDDDDEDDEEDEEIEEE